MRDPVCLLALMLAIGCVYPADDPTGLEMSWRFVEANLVDGEEGQRVRTCEGVGVQTLLIQVEDQDDPTRRGSFRFDCEAGYQTQTEFQTEASDVFIPLRPGDYAVSVTAVDTEGGNELLSMREVDVLARGLTVEVFELVREPVTWTLSLSGLNACNGLSLALYYADPAVALADPPENDEGEVEPTLYREGLQTDRALSLAGAGTACSPDLAGEHAVEMVDPGRYRLEALVDGRVCALSVTLGESSSMSIDLSNLPCEG